MTTPTRKQRSMTNRTLAYLNTFHTGPMTVELTAKIQGVPPHAPAGRLHLGWARDDRRRDHDRGQDAGS
jgi:hypothetical protein